MRKVTSPRAAGLSAGHSRLEECRHRAIELLHRNLTPAGILAASPGPKAEKRGYTAIFGRDAAVCAAGMALSGDERLRDAAESGLRTLAEHQAANGQMAKFVDVHRQGATHASHGSARKGNPGPAVSGRMPAQAEADFWYLGCIDSTLWWLIALAFLDAERVRSSVNPDRHPGLRRTLRRRYAKHITLAIQWLLAQEHQRFFLLQQNEASDWADIMPRSGFVLYTNALWYFVKRLYGLGREQETLRNFNGLFHPFSAGIAEYRRARLLNDYVLRGARDRDLYLSFVNFSFFGDEGDVFGNLLAVLLGLADTRAVRRTLDALIRSRVHEPYPVRAVARPIRRTSSLWRPYMARHRQNFVWQYHNGGIWPMLGGFWVAALVAGGRMEQARRELEKLAEVCELRNWAFTEWLHGRTLAPRGMPGQSWNAAAYLMAHAAVTRQTNLFDFSGPAATGPI